MNNKTDKDKILDKIDDMRYEHPFQYTPHAEGWMLALDTLEYWIENHMEDDND